MINTQIKVVDLDGMIVNAKSSVVNLEVSSLPGKLNKVIIRSESGEIVHSSKHKENDGLIELIGEIENVAENAEADVKEICLEIASYLENI